MDSTIKFATITEEKGLGIYAADIQGNEYRLGSYKIARDYTLENTHNMYLLKNKKLIATVDLQDMIKDNAPKAIEYFHNNTIETIMLSGDTAQKCEDVALLLSIKQVHSEQLPAQKLQLIEMYNNKGYTAMVGDGVNDAPALEKASVGIAIGGSAQAAIHSAQVVLLSSKDLTSLIDAHKISKHTLITIKQNLFWAFFYNVLAIPVAAVGLLSPGIAAAAMAFSDLMVIGNSIRLKTKKLV